MDNVSSLLPDLSKFPDNENRRQVKNLGEKIEILIENLNKAQNDEIEKIQKELNETWWDLNATLGALIAKTNEKRISSWRWFLSIGISIIAILISTFTLWQSNIAPYRLIVSSPAITQVNDPYPSLILDLPLYNDGARPAIISDAAIRTFSKGKELSTNLRAQKIVDRFKNIGDFSFTKGETKSAVFTSLIIKPHEVQNASLYFAPFIEDLKINEKEIISIDSIVLDMKINGRWRYEVFSLNYLDFKEKFIGGGVINIPEQAFTTRYFKYGPYQMTGNIFTNK